MSNPRSLSSEYVLRPVQLLLEDTANRRSAEPFVGPLYNMNAYEYLLYIPLLFPAPLLA
jgi:hypothetical protein